MVHFYREGNNFSHPRGEITRNFWPHGPQMKEPGGFARLFSDLTQFRVSYFFPLHHQRNALQFFRNCRHRAPRSAHSTGCVQSRLRRNPISAAHQKYLEKLRGLRRIEHPLRHLVPQGRYFREGKLFGCHLGSPPTPTTWSTTLDCGTHSFVAAIYLPKMTAKTKLFSVSCNI